MKKTAITLLACAALGVAYGQDEQQKSGFGLELNAAYNFALKDISKANNEYPSISVDTYGVDLTALYRLDKHSTLNIRFGWTTGDEDTDFLYDGSPDSLKTELTNIYIMPGYRYTGEITNGLSFFGGANVGLAHTKAKLEETYYGETWSENKSKWGFAWSAEVGLSQRVTNTGSVTLALQLQGLCGRPKYEELYDGKPENQLNLGVRLGYSCQF